jgi:hypothetical protein
MLSSQDGKFEPAIITAIIVGVIAVILGKFTGTKVFIFELSSGIIRLSIGLLSALYLSLWWGMKLHQKFSFGAFGTKMVAYSLLTCSVLAVVLIPIGTIQTVGAMIKTAKKSTKRP